MGKWSLLLGGLTVWTVHFFLLYAFASIFPGMEIARTLSLIATVPALAADAFLLWFAAAGRLARGSDALERWVLTLGGIEAALSLVAVLWQALPAALL